MIRFKKVVTTIALGLMAVVALPSVVGAVESEGAVVVTEADITRQSENTPPTDNWVLFTRAGTPASAAEFRDGPADPPLGTGSLELTTLTGSEKAFLFNYDNIGTRLADVDAISYSTYRNAGSAQQVAALNVVIDYNGPNAPDGFSTLVFEPVYNTGQGLVSDDVWQNWTASGSGVWWSTRAINGQCAGATAACDKTWNEIVANNPNATIMGGVGVNQGTGNPGLTTSVDAFTFDEMTYNFETKYIKAASKEECKNENWRDGFQTVYKNQGDCVSSVASEGRAKGNPTPADSVVNFFRSVF